MNRSRPSLKAHSPMSAPIKSMATSTQITKHVGSITVSPRSIASNTTVSSNKLRSVSPTHKIRSSSQLSNNSSIRHIQSSSSISTSATVVTPSRSIATINSTTAFSLPRIATTSLQSMSSAQVKSVKRTSRRFMASVPTQGNIGDVIGFPLADIGEGITEVEVLQWFVKPGDKIEQFQKVCEVQSDKANVEITSRYDGVVESLECDIGAMAKVGEPLIKIKLTTATANAPPKKTTATASDNAPQQVASATSSSTTDGNQSAILSTPKANNNVLASPVVRRMAREFGIELGRVRATGKLGQITKEDLLNYQQEISLQSTTPSPSPSCSAANIINTVAAAASSTPIKKTEAIPSRSSSATQDTVVNVTGIQRVMVKTMTAAAAIPTFGYSDEICVDNLVALRKQLVDRASNHGVRLSYFAFIIKALSLALTKYPQVNAHANGDCSVITQKGSHNIGLAMDTPRGLLVPNIKNVQDKSILQVAAELNRLQELGAAGKLSTDDLKGGTITLSNIGTIGGTYCTPILVVPEVAIGALGKFYQKAAFKSDGTVYPSTVMNIGWTADHRALDGATVARFSNEMKNYIENPHEMLLY